MTVEAKRTKEIYEGNGATTVFRIPFQYSKTEDISLLFTDRKQVDSEITSNFEIIVNSSGDTSVVYPLEGQPIPAGTKLTVYRNTPQSQIVNLIYGGAWSPDTAEHDAYDRFVMMIQELQEQVDRSVKITISDENDPPSAEDFYQEVEEIAERAEQWAVIAKEQADRAEKLVGEAELSSQVFNARDSWVIEADIPAGGTLTLPIPYFPTRNTLLLLYGNLPCTPKTARAAIHGQYQYEEVGTDPDVASYEVVLGFDASAGDVFDVTSLSTGVSTEEFERLVEQATAEAEAAREASEAALSAAERAEQAAISFPDLTTAEPGQVVTAQTIDGQTTAVWDIPPGGAVARKDEELAADIPAGGVYSVPAYAVGLSKLFIYYNSLLCRSGLPDSNATYQESGASGSISTKIIFHITIPAGSEIIAIAAS